MIKMSKNDWSNVKESGSGSYLLPAGGYICAIKNVEDIPSNNYVRVEYDIVKGDRAKFFTKKYDEDVKSRGKDAFWSGYFVRGYDEDNWGRWKGFITSIEESNPGKFTWNPEIPDISKMNNKYIGLVIGQREKQGSNGKVYLQNYVVTTKSIQSIERGDFTVPEVRKLDATKFTTKSAAKTEVDFSAMFEQTNSDAVDDSAPKQQEDNAFPWGGKEKDIWD